MLGSTPMMVMHGEWVTLEPGCQLSEERPNPTWRASTAGHFRNRRHLLKLVGLMVKIVIQKEIIKRSGWISKASPCSRHVR